ncbi:MAG: hypothetical protein JXB88_22240 [Spirochaetales bacterium]|nr:hypothetical protein [Spirochaetales bacterium]
MKKLYLSSLFIMILIFSGQNLPAVEICEKYGTVSVNGGEYIIQNNVWGADTRQCISTGSGTGFTISVSEHNQGAVASYPSIFKGCHWDTCTTGWTSVKVGNLSSCSINWTVETAGISGNWDVAAEIWFSPDLDCSEGYDGGAELMIWLDAHGVVPAGSKVGDYGPYEVWKGSMSDGVNTWTYICYYRIAETSLDMDLMPLIADAMSRGFVSSSMYLHDIEAGFELLSDGQGLRSVSFSSTIAGGGSGPQPGPTPALDPLPSESNPCNDLSSSAESLPFVHDGSGKFCWTFSSTPQFINSNNMEALFVNGVDFTGQYVAAENFPPKIDGKYHVYYKGNWDWSHFNAADPVATEPTPGGDTSPPTPTPTPEPQTPDPTSTPTPPPTPTPTSIQTGTRGDVNDDGTVDIIDALMVAQYYVGLDPSGFMSSRADVNCDGNIDIIDALRIAQYYVGLINSLEC